MNILINYINEKGILFSSLMQLDNKSLGNKKNITLFSAIDLKKRYWLILITHNTSKILNKDVSVFESLFEKSKDFLDHNFAQKALFFNAPICSKAKQHLQLLGWKLYDDFV